MADLSTGYRLGSGARDSGHRLHVHDRLGSTNAEAMALARAGEAGPLWIAARRQEAGRGRRGNVWDSVPGNLAASVLWPATGIEPEQLATLGFVAGVALTEALDAACGTAPDVTEAGAERPFRLKWPNDVLIGSAKLAGILLETETLPGRRRAVVIGFGVNVAGVPATQIDRAASLAGSGYVTDAGALLAHLSDRFAAVASAWDRGRGFAGIRQRWLARAAGLGGPIAVETGTVTLRGRFDGIDEGGRLVIHAPDDTRHTVTAGEVHFGTAATAA
ncbi:biotin--[acetyl-CoA-carboxylase] ligase [Methylobacterium symbioticum]